MRILAIESSGLAASAAVWADGCMIGEFTTNLKKTHSQTLLPMIDQLLQMLELAPEACDAIAVSAGPGSFTGLRIGSATAKGLGLALNLPIIEVPTVDALAYNLFGTDRVICPLMDARRQQVYTGLYTFEGEQMVVLTPQKAVAVTDILAQINEMGRPVVFTGDGVPVYREVIEADCKVAYSFTPAHLAAQRAGALASLAAVYMSDPEKSAHVVSAAQHQPDYLRLSQAERELAARQAAAIKERELAARQAAAVKEKDLEGGR